ncbi:SH3 domain-containing protein [Aliiroseovarius subalbicans]|uniref:SH3 domain-containing protein n=1 Tax=Aliiroseovarius subalbicans TaxID=2925840 RepID=UPI001F578FA7|nr:SH3 domain-containing protein [Aliiroseovarius subalbicans]MCI2399697.1 SH3 domain-containing protein [Aliiroseovarius subalbicans]
MGVLKLSGLTVGALALLMVVYGHEDGLPEDRIGREPHRVATSALPSPEPAPALIAQAAADIEPEPALKPILEVATHTSAPIAPVSELQPAEIIPATAEVVPSIPVLYVTGSKVNMRAGPSTGQGIVTALVRGTAVDDLGAAGDGWTQIRVVETGERGFMASRFLDSVKR